VEVLSQQDMEELKYEHSSFFARSNLKNGMFLGEESSRRGHTNEV
jgi:hypothetical protein